MSKADARYTLTEVEARMADVDDWRARIEQYGRDCRMIGDGPDGGDEAAYPAFPSGRWTDNDFARMTETARDALDSAESLRAQVAQLTAELASVQAQRDGAWEKSRRLLNEMDDQMDGSLVTLKVDILGMAFYRQTGIWPTFKSAPLHMHHELTDKERARAYSNWYYSASGSIFDPANPNPPDTPEVAE